MTAIIAVPLAVSAITFTICVTSIFEPVREIVSGWGKKFEELIHCPWCLGFYVTSLIVIFCDVGIYNFVDNPSHKWILGVINFFLTVMMLWSITGIIHYVLLRAYQPVAEATMHRHMKKLEQEKLKRQSINSYKKNDY